MLFSPPNAFGKQFFYRLIGYSCAVHVSILLVFFVVDFWLGMRPLVVSLRRTGGKVTMASKRTQPRSSRGRQLKRRQTPAKKTPVKKKAPVKKAPVKKVPKKVAKEVAKKTVKKAPVKKAVPKKPATKKAVKKVAKKAPIKKVAPQKKVPVKEVSKKASAKAVALPVTQDIKKAPSAEPKEVNAAEAAVSADLIEREFGAHLSIPAGFNEFEPFTITFDIEKGNVVNIQPHAKGPLVMYTAVKDALLKSSMPTRDRKHIVWLITS